MTTVWAETRQERRRLKARRWRRKHLNAQVGWRFFNPVSLKSSAKVHIHNQTPSPVDSLVAYSWCGRAMWARFYVHEYGWESESWVDEEPTPLTAENLCKSCRIALRADGTHPMRRRKKAA